MSVSTDKKAYSSREAAIIRGNVWDAGSGLDDAAVAIEVSLPNMSHCHEAEPGQFVLTTNACRPKEAPP
ncbi:hypothetical protein KAX14_02545 [Candidatus Bipolaricaulota bacterium]|nr:hypothetical protein [Candidatus Bipolaricaulota bacterium]